MNRETINSTESDRDKSERNELISKLIYTNKIFTILSDFTETLYISFSIIFDMP